MGSKDDNVQRWLGKRRERRSKLIQKLADKHITWRCAPWMLAEIGSDITTECGKSQQLLNAHFSLEWGAAIPPQQVSGHSNWPWRRLNVSRAELAPASHHYRCLFTRRLQ